MLWSNKRERPSAEQYSGALLEAAILNLRKCVFCKKRFADDASPYEQMLRQLIRSLNPKLVLCCGTFDQVKKIYKIRTAGNKIMMLDTGTRYFWADQSLFVDFVHPGAKICKPATYSYAKDVFKEIKNFV